VTVRIPRTGQIRLSGHISASFNQNAGSQTHMNNIACKYAMHNTSTYDPTQRSMDAAHGVVSALMLNDRYTNTNYGTNYSTWAANISTFNSIYNKQDTRVDGVLYSSSNSRSPSVESTAGAMGHQLNARVYDGQGAIYCQMNKNIGTSGSSFNIRIDVSTSQNVQDDFQDTRADCYCYAYPSGYLSGTRVANLEGGYVPLSSSGAALTSENSGTAAINPASYPHVVFGYRGRVSYPGYGSRIGTLRVKPHYVRLIATSGYA